MRLKLAIIVVTFAIFGFVHSAQNPLTAQRGGRGAAAGAATGASRTPPPSPQAAAAGDVKSVIFNWKWYMGMLRNYQEFDAVATFELRKSTGTIRVDGQPCTLTNYRASVNYQVNGMRAQYTCKLPNGQERKGIEVVSGQYSWDEDQVGAGLVAGKGTATPKPAARDERLIRIWAGPQGAAKAAGDGGANTKVSVEGGKAVVTFPIPGVTGATAKATLNPMNMAERVEVRHGAVVHEFLYDKYADLNPADDRIDGFFAGHIVEKRDGVTLLDINVVETHVGNLYVIMPVPASVKSASPAH